MNELYHHGIKGMHWGVENGPPYPLGSEGKKRQASQKKESDTASKFLIKTNKRFQLSDKQKKMIKYGAIAVGTGLAVYGAYKLRQLPMSNNVAKLTNISFDYNKGDFDIRGLDGVEGKKVLSLDNIKRYASNINPSGSRTNCGSTSTATIFNLITGSNKYEALSEVPQHMRKPNKQGYDPDKLIDCFEGGKWDTVWDSLNTEEHSRKIIDKLTSYGEGAKGILYPDKIRRKNESHYFAWMIKDGKPIIIETQPSTAQSEPIIWDKFEEQLGNMFHPNYGVNIARLDNVKIKSGREKDLFRIK